MSRACSIAASAPPTEPATPVCRVQVDFKSDKGLFRDEQVLSLPTIQLYVPRLGRVDRFALSFGTRGKLRTRLDKYLET